MGKMKGHSAVLNATASEALLAALLPTQFILGSQCTGAF